MIIPKQPVLSGRRIGFDFRSGFFLLIVASARALSLISRLVLTSSPHGIADRVEFQYNRVGEQVQRKDQNGSVHVYEFDNLGRLLHDRVTTLGSGVDGTVRRISTAYDVAGHVKSVTSFDNAAVGSPDT